MINLSAVDLTNIIYSAEITGGSGKFVCSEIAGYLGTKNRTIRCTLESMKKLKRFIKYFFSQIAYNFFMPAIREIENVDVLGSIHGEKHLVLTGLNKSSSIISCGVGEDISFEIELIAKCKLSVILIDPTPKSIIHFESICDRLGKQKEHPYSTSGSQNASSYGLSNIDKSQLTLVKKAIWNEVTNLHFYPPSNDDHVSFSIGNIQRSDSQGMRPIVVESTTLSQVCKEFDLNEIDLLKLDIEGAALEVIENSFLNGILPKQILVELEELSDFNFENLKRVRKVFRLLEDHNYFCFSRSTIEFSFLRNGESNATN